MNANSNQEGYQVVEVGVEGVEEVDAAAGSDVENGDADPVSLRSSERISEECFLSMLIVFEEPSSIELEENETNE